MHPDLITQAAREEYTLLKALKNLFRRTEPIDLSYSRIKTYEFCPLKYKLVYELGWKEPPMSESCLGLSLHRALEQFHKTQSRTMEDLIGYLDEYWVNDGYERFEDAYESHQRARRMLERYFSNWQKEKNTIVFLEKKFSFNIGAYRLQGTIDRVDKTPEGEYEIVDYKTKVHDTPRKQAGFNLQLGIYYLACERLLAKSPKLTIYCLETGQKITYSFEDSDKKVLLDLLKETALKIGEKNYYPNRNKCNDCGFKARCQKN